MIEYLGKLQTLIHDSKKLFPFSSTPSQELKQSSKFFMLLGLHRLLDDYSLVYDQTLGSLIVPNFTSTYFILLRVSGVHTIDIPTLVDNSSTLVFQSNDRIHPHKVEKGCHKCNHYSKLSHKIGRCYALHGHPPRYVMIA